MCVIESFVIVIFIFVFNGGRRKRIINYLGVFITGIILTTNVLFTTYGKVFSEYTFIVDLTILVIFSLFILKLRWYLILTSIILCYVFLIAGNMLGLEIVHLCFNMEYAALMGTNNLYTFAALIICKIIWIIFLGVSLHLKKLLNDRTIPWFELIILVMMGGITIIFVTSISLLLQKREQNLADELILFVLLMLVLDGFICWLLWVVTVQKDKILQINYLKKHIEDQKNIYYELLRNVDEIKKQRHNVVNALIALNVLIQKKEFNSLSSAMNQTIDMFSDCNRIDNTNENNMWLAIIDYKKNVALQKDIIFEVNVEYGDYTAIRGIDLCVLIGNLIDNAIEAEEKETDHREIELAVKNDFGAVYFCIKNYISQSVLEKNKSCSYSSKVSPEEHGYGLKTVRELVRQYNGILTLNEKENHFCVEVLLYPQ